MDGVVRCWDLRTGACVKKLGGHTEPVQDLAVSPDGSMIISGSDDNTARVFQWGQ
jgi:ribosome assembly protein SQT1